MQYCAALELIFDISYCNFIHEYIRLYTHKVFQKHVCEQYLKKI